MTDWYVEIEGVPVKVDDMMLAARSFQSADRTVAFDTVGPYDVSTVFLGLDHSFSSVLGPQYGPPPPILYETMVFARETTGSLDLDMERYSTREQARAGHLAMVEKVRLFVSLEAEQAKKEEPG